MDEKQSWKLHFVSLFINKTYVTTKGGNWKEHSLTIYITEKIKRVFSGLLTLDELSLVP